MIELLNNISKIGWVPESTPKIPKANRMAGVTFAPRVGICPEPQKPMASMPIRRRTSGGQVETPGLAHSLGREK